MNPRGPDQADGHLFDRVAGDYNQARFLHQIARGLVTRAGVGNGAQAEAARRVAPDRPVVGIDLAEPMAAEAARRVLAARDIHGPAAVGRRARIDTLLDPERLAELDLSIPRSRRALVVIKRPRIQGVARPASSDAYTDPGQRPEPGVPFADRAARQRLKAFGRVGRGAEERLADGAEEMQRLGGNVEACGSGLASSRSTLVAPITVVATAGRWMTQASVTCVGLQPNLPAALVTHCRPVISVTSSTRLRPKPRGGGDGSQVGDGGPAGVHGFRLGQRADLGQWHPVLGVGPAVDGDGAAGRSRPTIRCMVVDFPPPLGLRNPVICRSGR
jgi:hypothetical protein